MIQKERAIRNRHVEQVEVSSEVMAEPDTVWRRISTPEGINHELGPWLKMTVPRQLRGHTVDDVPLGRPLGRSWLLLMRAIPFDFDNVMLTEREPGRRFLETSTTLSMARWQHERIVSPSENGSKVSDRLEFEPRRLGQQSELVRRLMRRVVIAIFRHRHRRLTNYFAAR